MNSKLCPLYIFTHTLRTSTVTEWCSSWSVGSLLLSRLQIWLEVGQVKMSNIKYRAKWLVFQSTPHELAGPIWTIFTYFCGFILSSFLFNFFNYFRPIRTKNKKVTEESELASAHWSNVQVELVATLDPQFQLSLFQWWENMWLLQIHVQLTFLQHLRFLIWWYYHHSPEWWYQSQDAAPKAQISSLGPKYIAVPVLVQSIL